MSDSCLIRWIELLLFGTPSAYHASLSLPSPPPSSLKNLVLRMEAETIPWQHILFQGGFTAFPYQVHGDLNYLIDYLEKQWLFKMPFHEPSPFKTRAVSKFWVELQTLLSRRDDLRSQLAVTLPPPSQRDDAILKDLLETNHPGPHAFQSAAFWGEIARKFINLRRPETTPFLLASARPPPFTDGVPFSKRLLQLYDVMCAARGQSIDPYHLVLVHHFEHVNAAHWQTSENLEMFMRDRPTHPLTLSIQTLLSRTVDQMLQGEKPSALFNPCLPLDAFLHNVRVVHESVDEVSRENAPPHLIDVFHRLLVLSGRDALWEKKIPIVKTDPPSVIGTSLFYLTEQLRIAERERQVLWKHVIQTRDDVVSDPRPTSRICSEQSLDASDRHRQ